MERIASVIDDLAAPRTEAAAWLNRTAPIAARLNAESLTDDWPCTRCGLIGCEHDDDLPAYRGAFETEGRH